MQTGISRCSGVPPGFYFRSEASKGQGSDLPAEEIRPPGNDPPESPNQPPPDPPPQTPEPPPREPRRPSPERSAPSRESTRTTGDHPQGETRLPHPVDVRITLRSRRSPEHPPRHIRRSANGTDAPRYPASHRGPRNGSDIRHSATAHETSPDLASLERLLEVPVLLLGPHADPGEQRYLPRPDRLAAPPHMRIPQKAVPPSPLLHMAGDRASPREVSSRTEDDRVFSARPR